MVFLNNRHKIDFKRHIRKVRRENYKLIAAIYLITANWHLLRLSKRHMSNFDIDFESITLKDCTENCYLLFCAAKDLYLGTRKLSIYDMCDEKLMPKKLFKVICTAMKIKRMGLSAINYAMREDDCITK